METATGDLIGRLLDARMTAAQEFFPREVDRIVELCAVLAGRFARGGRLLAMGSSLQARSDAQHVAVEFVHPVIVGKRALPAIAVTGAGGSLTGQVDALVRADDAVIAFADAGDADAVAALELAGGRGALTIACAALPAQWRFDVPGDDRVRQELVETLYHVLWEHVHVFLDQQPVAAGEGARPAAGFLYPFLQGGSGGSAGESEGPTHSDDLLRDVGRSVLHKVAESDELRRQVLVDNRDVLERAAHDLRGAFASDATLFSFGNGGSATDAMDAAADLRGGSDSGSGPAVARRIVDLTADGAILSALANDIGPASMFARQLMALGAAGDVALAFSTSGDSPNIIEALAESRVRGMRTIAFVGYGGGRIAQAALADHVVVTRSEYVPRIQEAQATAFHALCTFVEGARSPEPLR